MIRRGRRIETNLFVSTTSVTSTSQYLLIMDYTGMNRSYLGCRPHGCREYIVRWHRYKPYPSTNQAGHPPKSSHKLFRADPRHIPLDGNHSFPFCLPSQPNRLISNLSHTARTHRSSYYRVQTPDLSVNSVSTELPSRQFFK